MLSLKDIKRPSVLPDEQQGLVAKEQAQRLGSEECVVGNVAAVTGCTPAWAA